MSNLLRKNFHLCFSGVKCLPLLPSPDDEDHHHISSASPLSSSSSSIFNTPTSVLTKNFNSFYDHTSESTSNNNSKSFTPSTITDDLFSSSDEHSEVANSPPDLASIYASQRFFFSSPGLSNSIFESTDARPAQVAETETMTGLARSTGGIAIHKYSPDPYLDFRRSMQEMVEARDLKDVRSDWDYLHELLLCYLRLNPKHAHKHIIGAFTDLIVSLMAPPETDDKSTELSLERRRKRVSRSQSMG